MLLELMMAASLGAGSTQARAASDPMIAPPAADGGFRGGSLGRYVSECVRTPDGWWFKSRRFNYEMPKDLPPGLA